MNKWSLANLCTIASKLNGTPNGVYLFISEKHMILNVANSLAPYLLPRSIFITEC